MPIAPDLWWRLLLNRDIMTQVQRARLVQMGIRIPRMVTKVAIRNVMQVCLVGIISVPGTVPHNPSVWVVTQSECVGGTYKAAHTVYYGSTSSCAVCGTNQYSDDGAASCTACKTSAGYGNSGTTAASHDGVASCKVTCDAGEYVPTAGGGCVAVGSGYYKTGTMTVAQNATNTTRSACSSLPGVSVSGGTYSSVSPYNASTTCRYKAPNKTITGCAAVTTATVAYSGSAWPATTYTVSASSGYYISGSGTASATCVGCEVGYACTGGTAARDACDGQTQYQDAVKQSSCKTVSSGWYKVDNTKQAQCTGATYCSGGVKNNCPGSYTADTTAGKTSAQQCKISVAKGHHIATANSSTPADCDPGDYRAAHTVNYGSTSSCSACPSGYTSAAGTAGANTECYMVGIISVPGTAQHNPSVWVVRIKPRIPCIMVQRHLVQHAVGAQSTVARVHHRAVRSAVDTIQLGATPVVITVPVNHNARAQRIVPVVFRTVVRRRRLDGHVMGVLGGLLILSAIKHVRQHRSVRIAVPVR